MPVILGATPEAGAPLVAEPAAEEARLAPLERAELRAPLADELEGMSAWLLVHDKEGKLTQRIQQQRRQKPMRQRQQS